MRQTQSLVIILLMVLSVPAFSQGSTGRRHRDPNYLVVRTVSELILSVDVQKSEVVMQDFDGKPHTVKVSKDTSFPDPAIRGIQDLRAGQRIRLSYRVVDASAREVRPVTSPPR